MSNTETCVQLERIFPQKHALDSKYEKHCVNCGCLIKKYTFDLSPIKIKEHKEILNGLRCMDCYNKLSNKLIEHFNEN